MVSTLHSPRFVLRTPQFVAFTRNGQNLRAINGGQSQVGSRASIPLSVWEDNEHVYIEADLPGLQPQHVDVRIEGDALQISAERAAPERVGHQQHEERNFGRLHRALGLGKQIDRSRVDAQLRDGVLSITLHKRPEAQVQKIDVRYANSESATGSDLPAAAEQA